MGLVRTGVAVARREQHDEVRLHVAKRLVPQAKTVHYSVSIVGEYDIADADQVEEGLDTLWAGQIKSQAQFIAIQSVEVGGPIPGSFTGPVAGIAACVRCRIQGAAGDALNRFDLDDLGAHVAQKRATERARPDLRELQGPDALQRQSS